MRSKNGSQLLLKPEKFITFRPSSFTCVYNAFQSVYANTMIVHGYVRKMFMQK